MDRPPDKRRRPGVRKPGSRESDELPGAKVAPEIRQLRYFVAVAEDGHFGRAAERLRISQPGLSSQIKALERDIGVPLLVRTSRGVELTKPGEVFLEHARRSIEAAERAVEATRAAAGGKTDLLKVGTHVLALQEREEELLDAFAQRHPEVEVDLYPNRTGVLVEQILRRAIDLALVYAPVESYEQTRYEPVGTFEPLIALPTDHPLAGLDRIPRTRLSGETFFLWPKTMNPRLFEHLRAALTGLGPAPTIVEIPSVAELRRLRLVAAGQGITLSESPLLAELGMSTVAFSRIDPPLEIEYGIVWHEDHTSDTVEAFIEIARELRRRN